jgi:hypothetical protein
MASTIAMRLVPAATQAGRGVVIKGVTAKETLAREGDFRVFPAASLGRISPGESNILKG